MSFYVQCFYRCFGLTGQNGTRDLPNTLNEPSITLDTSNMGELLVKSLVIQCRITVTSTFVDCLYRYIIACN